MDEIIKELKNLDLQNFWARMTEYASKPALTSAFNLEHKGLIKKLTDLKEAENDALEAKVHIYNVVGKDGKLQICNRCGGIISWDLRPERYLPLHCNELGQIVGDGNCHG